MRTKINTRQELGAHDVRMLAAIVSGTPDWPVSTLLYRLVCEN